MYYGIYNIIIVTFHICRFENNNARPSKEKIIMQVLYLLQQNFLEIIWSRNQNMTIESLIEPLGGFLKEERGEGEKS